VVNRILILIIGILIGVIVSGGAFWYFSASTGKNIFIVRQPAEAISPGNQPEKPLKSNLSEKKTPLVENNGIDKPLPPAKDTVAVLGESPEMKKNLEEKDSLLLAVSYDSSFVKPEEEIIVVKKDELLSSKITALFNLDHKQDLAASKKDSLLQNISGIKESNNNSSFLIEYWKSPINYRGYKMGRNKLVLFGLLVNESPKLYKLNEQLYLKNGDRVFRIEKHTDFRSFEPIFDPLILNQLN
jgi:hypothetical protein